MAKRKVVKKSEKIRQRLAAALRFANQAEKALYCHGIEKYAGVEYSQEQRQKLSDAQNMLSGAESIVKEVYAQLIGKQVVAETVDESWV